MRVRVLHLKITIVCIYSSIFSGIWNNVFRDCLPLFQGSVNSIISGVQGRAPAWWWGKGPHNAMIELGLYLDSAFLISVAIALL